MNIRFQYRVRQSTGHIVGTIDLPGQSNVASAKHTARDTIAARLGVDAGTIALPRYRRLKAGE